MFGWLVRVTIEGLHRAIPELLDETFKVWRQYSEGVAAYSWLESEFEKIESNV